MSDFQRGLICGSLAGILILGTLILLKFLGLM